MARIKDVLLTPALNEELVRQLDDIPEQTLRSWAQHMPGGFRQARAIRERLAISIRGNAPIEPQFLEWLEFCLPLRDAVSSLSIVGIEAVFREWASVVGCKKLLLSLLVDRRPEVQQFAARHMELANLPAPSADAIKTAHELYVEFCVSVFFTAAGVTPIPLSEDEIMDSTADPELQSRIADLEEETAAGEQTIARLRRELQEERQRSQARLKEQADKAAQERQQLIAERESARTDTARSLKEKSVLQTEMEQLRQNLDDAVARGVEEKTSATVRKWLERPRAVETALVEAESKSGDLLARAEAALNAQAQWDRHAGNRLELERKLLSLEAAHQRLIAALQTALKPVPELRPLAQDLESEIARLRAVLADAAPPDTLHSQLLLIINRAVSWDELRGCSRLIDQLAEYGLLDLRSRRDAYNGLHRKFSLLAESARPKEADADNGWSLRDALFRNRSTLLLLDGHNLLFGLPDIYGAYYEEGCPRRKARERLISNTGTLARNRDKLQVRVCFDGPEANVLKTGRNVEVHYSGGNGTHRAEELIVSNLQFKDLQSLDQKVYVVTDDRELRRRILQTGASFVPNDVFAVLLADFHCLD
jgi:hypothetical protein